MEQSLQVFKNPEFGEVRVVDINKSPWWVLKDVCKALKIKNPTVVARRLDEDEVTKFDLGSQAGITNIINESGLYNVVLRSDKPEAKRFKKWITSEVLPCIRKHGGYITMEKLQEALTSPDVLISLANQIRDYQKTVSAQKQVIGELKPKADYTDRILKSKDLVTITQIAKDYGMSAKQMNQTLKEMRIQYKESGQWLLYSKYHDKGYTHSETIDIEYFTGAPGIRMYTKWTQKGRLFLYNKLKEAGILPIIEQEDC